MKQCIRCGKNSVNPEEMPRYDVLRKNPGNDPIGPYDADCFALTVTGQHIAAESEGVTG